MLAEAFCEYHNYYDLSYYTPHKVEKLKEDLPQNINIMKMTKENIKNMLDNYYNSIKQEKRVKKQVLNLSFFDYSGAGERYSQAINRIGRYNCSSLKIFPHKYGYKSDYIVATKGLHLNPKNTQKDCLTLKI